MRLQRDAQLQQPQPDGEREPGEVGQPPGGAGQFGGGEGRHRDDLLARAAYTSGDSRSTAARSGESAVAAPSVRVMWSRPSVRAATSSPKADRTADAATEPTEMSRTEDVSRALERRLDVRSVRHGERAQRHQRMRGEPLLARPLQHVRRLPGMHRDQHRVPVPQLRRPHARHQAPGRRHRQQPQPHHRPVLGSVRELLGHREARPRTAVGVVRMPVDHPLLPLPVVPGHSSG
ncbi:hypothetical protein STENM223S_03660 [Streptomyces tendae]